MAYGHYWALRLTASVGGPCRGSSSPDQNEPSLRGYPRTGRGEGAQTQSPRDPGRPEMKG